MQKEFMYIPYIMSWLQHMAHKKGQYVIVAYWKMTFTSLMKLCHNHKDQLCNKNTSTHPSWSTLHYYSLVWFKKDKLIYSKALEYVASRCSDLGDTQFWIGSKKTWHTGIVGKNQRSSKIFLFKIFYTQLVLLKVFTTTPKLYIPSWV